MPVCCYLALLAASSLAHGPLEPTATPAELLLEPAAEPWTALQRQGTQQAFAPTWFVTVSGAYVEGDFGGPLGSDSDEYEAFGVDLGYTSWNDELGVTVELGYYASTVEVPTSSINVEDVDTQRVLVGLRLFDRGSDWWLPYLRGGFMWRADSGDTVDDDGAGFYVGGGFDFHLGANLRIGPQLLYTESESLNSTEWLLGGGLTFSF